jgi:hypothetical protein
MDQHSRVRRPLRSLQELHSVLLRVLDLTDPEASGLQYRLVGTSAALAQGVHLPASDVDILVARRDDVDRFATALSWFQCSVSPVWLADARQYFARFQVEQIDVEISTLELPADTDTSEGTRPGPWEHYVWEHYVQINLGRHVVPAVTLELQLITELVRDRPDRYTPLIEHMQMHGADLQFLLRAMREYELNPALQERIVARLRRQHPAGGPRDEDRVG